MKLIYTLFTFLFLSSSLYLTEQFNSIGNIMVSVIILMFFALVILYKKNRLTVNVYSLTLMFFFLLACLISGLLNMDWKLFITGAMIVVLYIASFVIIPSFNIQVNEVVYKSAMLSQAPLILVTLLLKGLDKNPYQGIFYNPNSFGTTIATIFTLLLSVFLFKLENYFTKKSKEIDTLWSLIIYIGGLLFMFFLIILSSSRTSFLTAVGLVMSSFLIVFIKLVKNKSVFPFLRSIFFGVLGIGIISLLIRMTPILDYLYFNIVYKFQLKLNRGDVLDKRGIVWNQTIKEARLFGNGSEYFIAKTLYAAHNTFISMLGEFGWVALILFVLFLLYGAYKSMKYALSGTLDKYKYMPILLFVCFIMLSMGESMLFKFSMIAMFFSFGSTVNLKRKDLLKLQRTSQ